MNGTRASVDALVRGLLAGLDGETGVDVAVFPSYVHLDAVSRLLQGSAVALGAQDVAREAPGAFTGEVAAEMLIEYGCSHVIVGHSERRQHYGESDTLVAGKVARALEVGLTPVVCVGETLEERESGSTEAVVTRQLDAVIEGCGAESLARCVIAYEPVWAIGTGRTASPGQADDVHGLLRRRVAERAPRVAGELRILYGGSVKADNAGELFAMPEIDGALVGGASLKHEEFLAICGAAA